MKRLALAAVVVVALTGTLTATAAQTNAPQNGSAIVAAPYKPPPECRAAHFDGFANAVWSHDLWERGRPRGRTVAEYRHRLDCAPSDSHRQAMKGRWADAKLSYGRYRALRLVAPYAGGGTWWAIPYYIVYCESGTSGLWAAANPSGAVGPYQLLGWGAPYPADTWPEKMANHRIAADVWAGGAGASNWVCA